MNRTRPLDIAIIGMACRFPGARDLVAYWENIVSGGDAISDVPRDRWDPDVFYDPSSSDNDRVYCRRGGYLDAPIPFDPAAHGIMPLAAAGGEPEQFLVLDAARAALADAGLESGVPDGRRVEVVIGRGNYFNRGNLTRLQHGRIVAQTVGLLQAVHPEWTAQDLEAVRADLKASLPPFGPATIAGQVTNATAGRVANRLDFRGASFVVDAASASSLVALDLGARALAEGRADLALIGGVYVAVDVDFSMVFSQLGALSRSGQARPFARDADGTLPGEGVGIVVLKRLADAERDGDRIYAVVKGVGVASDGRGLGLAAPSARGHARALRRAYRHAGIDPATVGLVEGHGLGVPASDRAELRALRAVFPAEANPRRVLGAVSSMIGHAMPAAGVAGLIKTALALYHRVLPPTLHASDPHPLLTGDAPFALNGETRPWIHGERATPRRAGVNAFGFAGISAHAVLEEHSASADRPSQGCLLHWESEAILLGAASRDGLVARVDSLLDWLEGGREFALKDLAYTLNTEHAVSAVRLGLVAKSPNDLVDRLRDARTRLADPRCRSIRDARGAYYWDEPLGTSGKLAFLFPGEGSQYPGMLADLCLHFPEVRTLFDTSDRIALESGFTTPPSALLFGASREQESALWSIGSGVNVVLSAQWALYQLLLRVFPRPDAVAGHSCGEFLSLAAAGVVRVDQLEARLGDLAKLFGDLEESGALPGSRLLAVSTSRERVEAFCRDRNDVVIAIDNCPHQVVLAGALDEVEAQLRAEGVLCEALPFARAYHTAAFAAVTEPFREFFAGLDLSLPSVPLYSCAISNRMPDDVEEIRHLAVAQWSLPVAFRDTVETMYADGHRLFVDVGARGNLAAFVEDTLRGRPSVSVAANLPRRSGLTQLNHLVATLFAHGVAVHADHLYARRRPLKLDLLAPVAPRATLPALAVGFPEMRLSDPLLDRLRAKVPPAAPEPLPAVSGTGSISSNGNGFHHLSPARQPILLRHEADLGVLSPPSFDPLQERFDHWPAAPVLSTPPHDEPPADDAVYAYLKTMDAFLEAQRQVMAAYLGAGSALATPEATLADPLESHGAQFRRHPDAPQRDIGPAGVVPGPWAGEIQQFAEGVEVVTRYILDAAGDPIAAHHTLGGRRVSALEPDRLGLAVLPFTIMAEMLAQAAALLVPGQTLVALRDVKAHKWIRYEDSSVTLELHARRERAQPGAVRVAIFNRGTAELPRRSDGPVVEGVAVFAEERPEAPPAPAFRLADPEVSRFTAESLYGEQWLFHGPALQAVTRVGAISDAGIEGTLQVLPRAALFRDPATAQWHTDFIIADAFTHLLGCWGLDRLKEADVIFPLRMGELLIYGNDPPEGSDVDCRITIRELERHRVHVDADLVGPGNRLWMQIKGWEDWRFHWDPRYRDICRATERTLLTDELPIPEAFRAMTTAVWLQPPSDFGRPVWRDVLEQILLAPEERAFRSPGATDSERTRFLWARIAAKEAARRLDVAAGSAPGFPADLIIEDDERGQAALRSLLEPDRRDFPTLAVAHGDGLTVALASNEPGARPGIAIAPIEAHAPEFEGKHLRDSERKVIDRVTGPDRNAWIARFLAAKRAAGFALCVEPDDVEVVGVHPEHGALAVFAHTDASRTAIVVFSSQHQSFIWAWTLGTKAGS